MWTWLQLPALIHSVPPPSSNFPLHNKFWWKKVIPNSRRLTVWRVTDAPSVIHRASGGWPYPYVCRFVWCVSHHQSLAKVSSSSIFILLFSWFRSSSDCESAVQQPKSQQTWDFCQWLVICLMSRRGKGRVMCKPSGHIWDKLERQKGV